MDWQKLSLEEKSEFLVQQLQDMTRARKLLDHFERVTLKWLKRVHAARVAAENAHYKVDSRKGERRDEKPAEKPKPRR